MSISREKTSANLTALPPNNKHAERGVLVCILNNPKSVMKVVDRLKPEHFYHEQYAQVYECAVGLYRIKKLPTPQNLADELARRKITDRADPIGLFLDYTETEDHYLYHDIEDYAEMVIRTSVNRRLIYAAQQILQDAYSERDGSLASAEEAIAAIAFDGDIRGGTALSDAVDRYIVAYEQRRKDYQDGKPIGVRTGFRAVDFLLGGFRPGTLNILAARTSVGKTSLALNIALNIASRAIQDRHEVAFFSLEMLEDELVQRLFSMETHLDQSLLRDGCTDDDQHAEVLAFAPQLKQTTMTIFDSVYRLDMIRSNARVLCSRRKIGLIIVDYLQLVDLAPNDRTPARLQQRYLELGEISKGLKRLAQELRVPVLALAQLNRESEKYEAPELRHLGESGKLENDADMVAFLSCDKDNLEKRAISAPYKLDFSVKKHRNGRLGNVELMFIPHLTRFGDMIVE